MSRYDVTMIRRQIQLRDDQDRLVRELAGERGMSFSALVREAVDHLIIQAGHPDDAVARSLASIGRYRGGPSDVSERHDHYAGEAAEVRWRRWQ